MYCISGINGMYMHACKLRFIYMYLYVIVEMNARLCGIDYE